MEVGDPKRRTGIRRRVLCGLVLIVLVFVLFSVFFDEAVLCRKGTICRIPNGKKLIALTFDDGPSPRWTPQVLDELRKADVHATFFMLGKHVRQFPEVAAAVAAGGHEIGNHTYDHRVLLFYADNELEDEIKRTEEAIKAATGRTTCLFRPPKSWLTESDKDRIKTQGYETVLWSLNSKDWVTWDDKYVVAYLERHVRPGDIILFHDSGGVFMTEGGDRHETVKTIPRLVARLRKKGYTFVTVGELLAESRRSGSGGSVGGDGGS